MQRWYAAHVGRSVMAGGARRMASVWVCWNCKPGTAGTCLGNICTGQGIEIETAAWVVATLPLPVAAATARSDVGVGGRGWQYWSEHVLLVMHNKTRTQSGSCMDVNGVGWRPRTGTEAGGHRGRSVGACTETEAGRPAAPGSVGRAVQGAGTTGAGRANSWLGSGAAVIVRRRGLRVTSRLGACKAGRGWGEKQCGPPSWARSPGGPDSAVPAKQLHGSSCKPAATTAASPAPNPSRTGVEAHVVMPLDGFRGGGLVERRPRTGCHCGADLRLCIGMWVWGDCMAAGFRGGVLEPRRQPLQPPALQGQGPTKLHAHRSRPWSLQCGPEPGETPGSRCGACPGRRKQGAQSIALMAPPNKGGSRSHNGTGARECRGLANPFPHPPSFCCTWRLAEEKASSTAVVPRALEMSPASRHSLTKRDTSSVGAAVPRGLGSAWGEAAGLRVPKAAKLENTARSCAVWVPAWQGGEWRGGC